MLEVRNLSLSLTGNEIFTDIHFSASPGSITHLEGKNGSGKTSLLKCMTGIYQKFEGEITIENHQVSNFSIRDYSPLLSFLIDKGFCYPFLSVADNLKIFKYYNNVSILNPRLQELIDEFGLSNVLDKKVSRISAGYKQKLEIVIALLNGGKYVLLDEPAVNLDKASIDILYNYVVQTAELQHKAYIVVSHNDITLSSFATHKLTL